MDGESGMRRCRFSGQTEPGSIRAAQGLDFSSLGSPGPPARAGEAFTWAQSLGSLRGPGGPWGR